MEIFDQNTSKPFLDKVSGWHFMNNAIEKKIVFNSFPDAIAFIVQIGFIAEKTNHHPEIHNVYRTVTLQLTTHDFGGVTKKDFELAASIDTLLSL